MKRFSIGIIAFLFFITGLFYVIFFTSFGIKTLLFAANNFFKINIQAKSISGNLLNNITANQFIIKTDDVFIKLSDLKLAFNSRNIFYKKQIEFIKFTCNKALIKYYNSNYQRNKNKSQKITIPQIKLPIQLKIKFFFIKKLELILINQQEKRFYYFDNIFLSLKAKDNKIILNKLSFKNNSLKLNIDCTGSLALKNSNIFFNFNLNGIKTLKDTNSLKYILETKGNLLKAEFKIVLNGPVDAKLTGAVSEIIKEPLWQVSFSAKIKEINKLYQNIQGEIIANGQIRAKSQIFTGIIKMQGNNIFYENNFIKQTKITVNLYEKRPNFIADLNATKINFNQKFIIDKISSQFTLNSLLSKNNTYYGTITKADIYLKKFNKIKLEKETHFRFSENSLIIKNLYLYNKKYNTKIKSDIIYDNYLKQFIITLYGTPLNKLNLLSDNIKLNGNINIFSSYKANQTKNKFYEKGNIIIKISNGIIKINTINKYGIYPFNFNISGQLDNSLFKANGKINITELAKANATLKITNFNPLKGQFNRSILTANINLLIPSLKKINPFLNAIVIHSGSFNSDIFFNGELTAINSNGFANLSDIDLEIPEPGIRLISKKIDLKFNNRSFILKGDLLSKTGKLKLAGNGVVKNEDISLKLDIHGNNYQVLNNDEISLRISPELNFSIVRDKLFLSGKIAIPFLRISQIKLPEDIKLLSKDIVIKEEHKKRERLTKTPLNVDVKVIFGKDAKIDAYGLKGNIKGFLKIKKASESLLLASGELFIENGYYNAYGVTLKIEKGRFLYSLSPIDNPVINIIASKQIESDKIVGVKITGTLKEPILTLFSQPTMPQAEIMAYLMGQKKEKGGFSSSSLIAGGSNLFLSKIREKLGFFNEMKFDANPDNEDISLILGTYLRPDLYVKFINDFGEKMSKIILRYEYSKHIEIQTETGESPSIDIFYKIER